MSMFNDEQRAHMRYLDAQSRESLSWCGWGRAGDPHCCGNPDCVGKKHGLTAADKMTVWCPECHNEPWNGGVITHRKGCSQPTCPVICAHCWLRPASCVGAYAGMPEALPACDTCCGHACEDGHCEPIATTPDQSGEKP